MEQPDIEAVLVDRLASERGVDRQDILCELARGDPIDSLEGLDLAIAAETAFAITISDDELSSGVCRSVSAMTGLVRSKLVRPSERKEAAP